MFDFETLSGIKPSDLPAPPQAALQVMRACARDNVDHAELARLASSDPLLAAELLRVVNSPLFGFSGNIKSIARAIAVLGHKALRNLALCLAVRDALQKETIPGFDLRLFWEDALRLGVCARMLGVVGKLDPDECFTAGLLQDFGLLVLFHLQPELAPVWPELRGLSPGDRPEKELQLFGATHEAVWRPLAKAWSLPASLAIALKHHHHVGSGRGKATAEGDLRRVLHVADWLAAVFTADDKSSVLLHSRKLLGKVFGMGVEPMEEFLAAIPARVEEAAAVLGLRIGPQQDYDSVLRKAHLRLAEDHRSSQELTWQLGKALKERNRLAAELDREMSVAREIQRSLLPKTPAASYPVSAFNLSARQLSGDFYDFFTLADGRIYFVLGDVAGKGTTAALLMAKVISLFRCLGKRVADPGLLFAQINNEICETTIRGMFITLAGGLYDPATGEVVLVNAGHPPVLVLHRNGKYRAFEAEVPPLGIVADQQFHETRLALGKSSLYLYSDGVIECRCAQASPLGLGGLLDHLRENHGKPPAERLDAIAALFTDSSLPLRDDVTVLLLEKRDG